MCINIPYVGLNLWLPILPQKKCDSGPKRFLLVLAFSAQINSTAKTGLGREDSMHIPTFPFLLLPSQAGK